MLGTRLNKEILDAMPFLDYLKWMQENLNHLSYSKGSSNSYWEAREIIQSLIRRYEKEFGLSSDNFHYNQVLDQSQSTEIRLNDFVRYADTNSTKAEAIATFKSDIESDLSTLIFDRERQNSKSDH